MTSFYGGQQGKSFEIKKVYSSYADMLEQLLEDNSILPGEFVMVSYGQVGTDTYDDNKDKDKEYGFYGSTLWIVKDDKTVELITSTAGEAATLTINIGAESGLEATPESGPLWKIEGDSINRILNLDLPDVWNIEAKVNSIASTENASVTRENTNNITKTFIFDIPRGVGISDVEIEPPVSFNTDSEGINTYILNINFDNNDTQKVEFSVSNGKQGEAATIEVVSTVTSEPKTEAKVENIGTKEAAKLKFTIPQGEKGEQGYSIEEIILDGDYDSESEATNKYMVKLNDPDKTIVGEFNIVNGKAGIDGVTINKIEQKTKTDASTGKTVEGYGITFSDGKAFDVYNGAEGPAGSADTLITNEYSEANKMAYSSNFINNNFWNYSQNIIEAPKYNNYIKLIATVNLPKRDWAHFCGWFLISSYPEVIDQNADNAILGLLCLEFGSNGNNKYGDPESYGLRGLQGMRWLSLSNLVHEKEFIAKVYKTEEWTEGNTPISIDIYNNTVTSIQVIYLGMHEELTLVNRAISLEEYETKYTDNILATYTSVFDAASSPTFEAL